MKSFCDFSIVAPISGRQLAFQFLAAIKKNVVVLLTLGKVSS